MRAITGGVVALVLVAAIRAPAWAQQVGTVPIDSGTVVRIRLSARQSVRGRLLQTFRPSDPTLTFCRYPGTPCSGLSDARVDRIPAADVEQIEVAHGTHWIKGALIGGVVGGLLAMFYIQAGHAFCDDSACEAASARYGRTAFALALGVGVAFGSQSVGWRHAP